jgi:hypothetical protein
MKLSPGLNGRDARLVEVKMIGTVFVAISALMIALIGCTMVSPVGDRRPKAIERGMTETNSTSECTEPTGRYLDEFGSSRI